MSSGKGSHRRYIPPSGKNVGRVVTITKDVNVTDVIASAVSIIKQQMDNLAARSNMGGTLESEEVKNLRIYIQSLCELSREDRERTKHDGIEDWIAALSTEELVKLAQGKTADIVRNADAVEAVASTMEAVEQTASSEAILERSTEK